MIWWGSAIILMVMMGALQVAPTKLDNSSIIIDPLAQALLSSPHEVVTTVALLLVLLSCYGLRAHTTFQPIVATDLSSNHINPNHINPNQYAMRRGRRKSLIALLIKVSVSVALVMISILLVVMVEYQAQRRAPPAPIRVQALVTIKGLSDSLGSINNQSYRQLAVIDHIQALELSHQASTAKQSATQQSLTAPFVSISSTSPSSQVTSNPAKKQQQDISISNPWQSASSHVPHSISADDGQFDDTLASQPVDNGKAPLTVLLSSFSEPSDDLADGVDPKTRLLDQLKPGQQVLMTLALSPLSIEELAKHDSAGFNVMRWLRTRHVDARAQILSIEPLSISADGLDAPGNVADISVINHLNQTNPIDQVNTANSAINQSTRPHFFTIGDSMSNLRWQLRQHFLRDWASLDTSKQQARAVTLSLLTGDRALITRQTKQTYQLAGISHLLAISGSHVLFLAVMLAAASTKIVDWTFSGLYRVLPRWQLRWSVMVVTAFIYATFTGFDVPAARTAWMLVAIGIARFTLLPISSLKVLALLAVIMAWHDPYVLWQAGYWLSFVAVAFLLIYEQSSQPSGFGWKGMGKRELKKEQERSAKHQLRRRLLKQGLQMIKLQVWIFAALLPITLLLFQKASLWGLGINLVAIGVYGLVIVPLNLLAGSCYLISPTLADWLWGVVNALVYKVHQTIETIVELPLLGSASDAWLYLPVNFAALVVVAILFVPWLFPKALLSRWLSLPAFGVLYLFWHQVPEHGADTSLAVQSLTLPIERQLYLLPSQENLSAMLLTDSKRQTQWLILADYRVAKLGFAGRQTDSFEPSVNLYSKTDRPLLSPRLNIEAISSTLQQQLEQLSIDELTGIIVQTPTDHQGPTLKDVARRISAQRPVGYLWQAGQRMEANGNINLNNPNKTDNLNKSGLDNQEANLLAKSAPQNRQAPAKPTSQIPISNCQPKQKWSESRGHLTGEDEQRRDSQLTIEALTGWPELEVPALSSCALAIDTVEPIKIYRLHPQQAHKSEQITGMLSHISHPDQLGLAQSRRAQREATAADTDTDTDSDVQINTNTKTTKTTHRLIIDASTHRHLWPLYFQLCESSAASLKPIEPSSNAQTKSAWGTAESGTHKDGSESNVIDTVIITHPRSSIDSQSLSKLTNLP